MPAWTWLTTPQTPMVPLSPSAHDRTPPRKRVVPIAVDRSKVQQGASCAAKRVQIGMVLLMSSSCQKVHWKSHKSDCHVNQARFNARLPQAVNAVCVARLRIDTGNPGMADGELLLQPSRRVHTQPLATSLSASASSRWRPQRTRQQSMP